jgi:hypothetical protein
MAASMAFRLSGRLRVAESTPPRTATWTDFHAQQSGREHFALRVGLERQRAAPTQGAVQQEVQCPKVGQLESLDRAGDHALEMARHPGGGDLAPQDVIVLRSQGDQADVGRVALVSAPGVSHVTELDSAGGAAGFRPHRRQAAIEGDRRRSRAIDRP